MNKEKHLKRIALVFLLGSVFSPTSQASSPGEKMNLGSSSSAPAALRSRAAMEALLARVARGDPASIEELRPLATGGDAGAQFLMGNAYIQGNGVRQDFRQAREWLQKSADQGNAPAQFALGEIYEDGLGVPKNQRLGIELQRKAADGGFAPAQHNMGTRHLTGSSGVEQNPEKAAAYFKESAQAGFADSQYSLGVMHGRGEGGLQPSHRKAAFWIQKAADQGHESAQNTIEQASRAALEEVMESASAAGNSEHLIHEITELAKEGNTPAQAILGMMYNQGELMPRDTDKAIYWLQKAAIKGHVKARELLAQIRSANAAGRTSGSAAASK